MIHLGVNIDHVATLRNARGGTEPDPLTAAQMAAIGGADSITVHLREDRRHIKDEDVKILKERLDIPLNLEMSVSPEIVDIAMDIQPYQVTLVPERREERTTECGLDVVKHQKRINCIAEDFRAKGIIVSLFVDPEILQLQACLKTPCRTVELHTGAFAECKTHAELNKEIKRLEEAAKWCAENGVTLHAGHGLNYHNTREILHLPGLRELNIGHSIVSRSVFVGLEKAVQQMRRLINQSTSHEVIEKSKSV